MIYYAGNGNFGDVLNIVLARALEMPVTTSKESDLCIIGSVIDRLLVTKGSLLTVAGAGFINEPKPLVAERDFEVIACRGKLTAEALSAKSVLLGDPAVAVFSAYHPDNIRKRYDSSYAPHFSIKNVTNDYGHYIDLTKPVKLVIDDIIASRHVFTSSLHVKICCDFYGIPLTLTQKRQDADICEEFKFKDYFSALPYPQSLADNYLNLLCDLSNGRCHNNCRLSKRKLEERIREILR